MPDRTRLLLAVSISQPIEELLLARPGHVQGSYCPETVTLMICLLKQRSPFMEAAVGGCAGGVDVGAEG